MFNCVFPIVNTPRDYLDSWSTTRGHVRISKLPGPQIIKLLEIFFITQSSISKLPRTPGAMFQPWLPSLLRGSWVLPEYPASKDKAIQWLHLKSRLFCFLCELANKMGQVQNKTGEKNKGKYSYLLRFLSWARVTIRLPPSCLSCREREMRASETTCLYLSKIKYIDPKIILRMCLYAKIYYSKNW